MYKKFREISSSCLVLTALLLSISYSQSIDELDPNSGTQGQNDLQVYLYASGVNFYDSYSNYGSPQSVSFSGGGISANNLQIVNSSTVKFDVDISFNTSISSRDVTLYTNNNSLYKTNAFTVTENNDGIGSISNTEVEQDEYGNNIFWNYSPNGKWEIYNASEVTSTNGYENLIKTFDKYFGEFVDLER